MLALCMLLLKDDLACTPQLQNAAFGHLAQLLSGYAPGNCYGLAEPLFELRAVRIQIVMQLWSDATPMLLRC